VVLCEEHGVGGGGEYCGDNDVQRATRPHQRVYHEASGDNYVPRTVFSDLEHGVIDAVRASPLG
jgi:tubulin beta